jgi:hypothetical protein
MRSGLLEGSSAWPSADFKPCAQLLAALLEDVYSVRDLVARYEARRKKPPPGIRGQYAHDRQWITEEDECSPFSFD